MPRTPLDVELSYRAEKYRLPHYPPPSPSGEARGQNPEDKCEEQISSPIITGVSLKTDATVVSAVEITGGASGVKSERWST